MSRGKSTGDSHPLRRPPTLEALRALVAFADAGESVSAAARALGALQPVITTKLRTFQAESSSTGAILLERDPDGRRLRLTDAGRAALPPIREIVRQYDQLLEYLRGESDEPVALRLAVGAFGAEHFVPQTLAKLKKNYGPEWPCSVKTLVVRGRDRIVGVADGSYDLAIVSHSRKQIARTSHDEGIRASLTIKPLTGLPLVVAAGKKTPEARALGSIAEDKSVSLKMLDQFELAGPDPQSGLRRQLEEAIGEQRRLTFAAEGGGWAAAREFARFGLGAAILPAACLGRFDKSQIIYRSLDPRFRLEHSLIFRSRQPVPTEYIAFLSALHETVGSLADK